MRPTLATVTRGLGPQGVGSEGSISLGYRWFSFGLIVLLLSKTHEVSGKILGTKEVNMNKKQNNGVTSSTTFLNSLITTMWAMGTSVAAGALSA